MQHRDRQTDGVISQSTGIFKLS